MPGQRASGPAERHICLKQHFSRKYDVLKNLCSKNLCVGFALGVLTYSVQRVRVHVCTVLLGARFPEGPGPRSPGGLAQPRPEPGSPRARALGACFLIVLLCVYGFYNVFESPSLKYE